MYFSSWTCASRPNAAPSEATSRRRLILCSYACQFWSFGAWDYQTLLIAFGELAERLSVCSNTSIRGMIPKPQELHNSMSRCPCPSLRSMSSASMRSIVKHSSSGPIVWRLHLGPSCFREVKQPLGKGASWLEVSTGLPSGGQGSSRFMLK